MQAIFTAGRNKYLQASSDWVLLQNLRHSHLRKTQVQPQTQRTELPFELEGGGNKGDGENHRRLYLTGTSQESDRNRAKSVPICGISCIDDDHLDAALAQPVEVKGLDAIVGDDAVDSLQVADLAEAAASEFRTVGQYDDLLRRSSSHGSAPLRACWSS